VYCTFFTKACKLVDLMCRDFSHIDPKIMRHIHNSMICPHFEYASAVWDPCNRQLKDIRILKKGQQFACKVCSKTWSVPYDHTLANPCLKTSESWRLVSKLVFITHYCNNFVQPLARTNALYYILWN